MQSRIFPINEWKALTNEGLGSAYEHFVKARYLMNLMHRFHVREALEVQWGMCAESLALVNMQCEIVVVSNPKQNLKDAQSVRGETCFQNHIEFMEGNLSALPLNSNAFDLVWNSGDIKFERLYECIREMARVSKHFVLVFAPNCFHIGDIFFRLFLRIAGNQSQQRHPCSMSLETLSLFFREANLTIIERGGIDMPLWPSHLYMGNLMRKSKKAWNWTELNYLKFLRIQSALEESLPTGIKAAQAHMIYVLGVKT